MVVAQREAVICSIGEEAGAHHRGRRGDGWVQMVGRVTEMLNKGNEKSSQSGN